MTARKERNKVDFNCPKKMKIQRYIFCSDDARPFGRCVCAHPPSTLRQIDVRALLLHFLINMKKKKKQQLKTGRSVKVCWFSLKSMLQRKISCFLFVCFGAFVFREFGRKRVVVRDGAKAL